MNNDDFFNFLVATDTLDDFLGYKDPNNNFDDIEDIKDTDEEETTENDDIEEMD